MIELVSSYIDQERISVSLSDSGIYQVTAKHPKFKKEYILGTFDCFSDMVDYFVDEPEILEIVRASHV
jgi:hypothetical protein